MQRLSLCGLAFLLAPVTAFAADPGLELFEKKIRPVLIEKCAQCHSAAARQTGKLKAGLYVDSRAGLLAGGETGPAVVPGKPNESLLLKAIAYTGDFYDMPPSGKLPEQVIADFRKWIELGAPDPRKAEGGGRKDERNGPRAAAEHWVFQPPQRRDVPAVKDASWPAGAIDRFVLARLESQSLRPVGDAERTVLARRVYYDLIGLPPTPEQREAFVRDDRPDAYERLVEELLASPEFGERWGRHWLDVVRYADSSGGGRTALFPDAWRYRDYVIETFNQDRPFDRFLLEQIAGDLLPATSREEQRRNVVATAFLALGPTNYERQDKDLLEMDVIDEQLDTIGKGFLGLTLGCARCHDHKFDPIPTRDYYALAGIFRSTRTLIHDNVSRWVDTPLPMSEANEEAIKNHERQVATLDARIKSLKSAVAQAKPPEKEKPITTPGTPIPIKSLAGIIVDDAQAKQVGAWKLSQFSKNYIGDGYLHDENSAKGEKTLSFVPELPHSGRYEVRLAYNASASRADAVPVTIFHADGENTVHVNQRQPPPIDGRFVSLGQFRFENNGQSFVLVANEETNGHVIADAVQFLPLEQPTKADASVVTQEDAKPDNLAADLKKLEAELQTLKKDAPPRDQSISVREHERIGDCPIYIRGNLNTRGPLAPRGFLTSATVGPPSPVPEKESGRRQLGEWLGSRSNPLTARVLANRVWHWLIGAGLVRTVDNFGVTGETPSHPELLDNLALRLMDEGWSVKWLVREVVLSRTYRLSTADDSAALAADPENRLCWRMNRRRLDAELIRDTILTLSGQLDPRMAGPSIKPGTTIEYGYKFDETRRSVYTPVFRNTLPELFEAFDFADPNQISGRRNNSTVATQGLYLMNHPFVLEQADLAARRALADGDLTDAERIQRAYREAVGRAPTAKELELSLKYVGAASTTDARARLRAWSTFFQSVFACLDFRYVE